jgi:hypothetical protein
MHFVGEKRDLMILGIRKAERNVVPLREAIGISLHRILDLRLR